MSKPYEFIETLSGVGAESFKINANYMQTNITIIGLDSGILAVRAKEVNNNVFETVVRGQIDLSHNRSIQIEDVQLSALEFTVTPEKAYTVKVKQYFHQN